ncbi:MAG: TatD family hydrolase [Candidatus Anaerobiospirillum merdipullorum]|uniref:TatD family hydrolase n=1 Tax=Candidatus Anaerobiospirillum merdipullorum TaxID=2838450 RepID=A0A9E2KNJ4_9GAMM|nr:TatD family hydrolase [Candidatus Anaerobiospirillum merdipullorum]
MTYFVDSHCHLNSLSLQGKAGSTLAEIVARARAVGMTHMLCVACTPQEYAPMCEALAPFKGIYRACGVHPLNLLEVPKWQEEDLLSCLNDKLCVALGETGLDYHYAADTRMAQLDSFARQLDLAQSVKKPLIVHAREAHQDTVALLKSHQARDVGGVMHCFCDEVAMARECLDLGFYISFSGIVTFKAGENVREVARYVPLDRILVETDCPYLAPVPVRGVENEPAFCRYTLEFLAALKGVSVQALAAQTAANFANLFKVDLAAASLNEVDFTALGVQSLNPYKLERVMHTL